MAFINVVGVQFRRASKVYDFHGSNLSLHVGDFVVVDTDRGPSVAQVARLRYVEEKQNKDQALKKIIRRAQEKDLINSSKFIEDQVLKIARDKVEQAKLDMHILKAEIQFGGSKIIVYFSAPGRVDFRDLVKDHDNCTI